MIYKKNIVNCSWVINRKQKRIETDEKIRYVFMRISFVLTSDLFS